MLKLKFKKAKKTTESPAERRRYLRFPIMYNLDLHVYVRLLPYYRSEEIEGKLDNLSAGGLALRIPKFIPEKNFMYIQVTLPGGLCITCHCEVKHTKKINEHEHRAGLEFLDLPSELKEIILTMSKKYIECGEKIKQLKKTDCTPHCTAHSICNRHEKVYFQNTQQ